MRLSTSTSFFGNRLDGSYIPFKESLHRCYDAGFRVLDACFCHALFGKTDFVREDWQQSIYELRNEADRLGVEFTQSHPVFLPGHIKQHPEEKQEVYRIMMERSIIASSMLGVKWAVVHPVEARPRAFDTEDSIRENIELHSWVVELAIKHSVGIAFENMIERPTSKRRFASHAGELAALIDAFNDPWVGACWDFGHGNFLYDDQRIALRTLGQRLKATHVNDNYGKEDEHMFPFHGSVDWHALVPVLTEIGYEGDFTYETHKEFDKLPDQVKDQVAKAGFEIGQYCLSLA
ncbi:sugar phosphate isomerase/epimerase family protein [Marinicrinis lubricantis]|uniref:Sugar phosphate isomerase/epimerase family protein n=1 Tax=Marinicrinis lubricantis TaxID=2086470 RepID=A0ABW1ITR4_9BACL